ncbi:MAG TPA: hypothetical protein VKH35_05675 [Thermoanaerobaculia bacterium]|jgi:hypothetical protein|nr:hypothetical protein [Thermoanaerobaculia bacterium]
MSCDCEIRRCAECRTVFEACTADRAPDGEPRCPQCGLAASVPAVVLGEEEFIIRASTPFR